MTEPNICPSCHRPLPPDAPGGLCPACVLMGAREDAPPPGLPDLDQLRAAFPQFEILECIGRGGMGAVYKARQPQLDRIVALKILLPGLERDPGFAERFAREARALAKLNHPNIVAVHDFGESGGLFWLTMEFVDGVNLRQAMQAARFTPAQALAIIPELCSALQYAHDHGVLHRDIKPENILLDARGKVKVADFGIARMAGDERLNPTLTMTGAALGTTAYVAPEQIENPRAVDHRADLYSLGVVLYEMLTGELPLGRFPAPSERSASDPRLDEVVFRSLEKHPEKRYQQAEEFSNKVAGAASLPPAPGVSAPASPKRRKTSVLAVAGAICTGFSMLLGVPVLGALLYELPRGGPVGLGSREMMVLFIVSVLPALCGMVLGAISWVQIRDSEGTLRGLGLARFAVLAWPLLGLLAFLPKGPALVAILAAGLCYGIFRWIAASTRKASPVRSPLPGRAHAVPPAGGKLSHSLVPWSIGLIIGGLTLLGIGGSMNTTILIGLGACAIVLGWAGGWWALRSMRAGTLPLAGRGILLALAVWLPVVAGAGLVTGALMDHGPRPYGGKGDYFVNVAICYGAVFVFSLACFGLSALRGERVHRRGWLSAVAAVLSISLGTGSLLLTKQKDGRWPAAHALLEEEVWFPEPKGWQPGPETSTSPVKRAMQEAAGEYRDKIRLQQGENGGWRIGIMARDRAELKAHWLAFRQRLFTLLPAESAIGNPHGLHPVVLESHINLTLGGHSEIPLDFLILAAASAVLAGWCFAPLALACAGLSIAAGAALAYAPVWRTAGDTDEMLITGPPLPPVAFHVTTRDFSSLENAARTTFDAARAGDMELMKQGMSKRLRAVIDDGGAWERVMERLAVPTTVSSWADDDPSPERAPVYRKSVSGGGPLMMQLEDGGWRLDDLPFVVSKND